MKTLEVVLEGTSALSFSRDHREPMLENKSGSSKETHDAYEERTWRNKLHVTPDGHVYIPPMALKAAIEAASTYNPVKKKGTASWSRNVTAGVLIVDEILVDGLKAAEVKKETVMCCSDGKPARFSRGGKVPRTFPLIPPGWKARATIMVLDESIPEKVIEQHLQDAGVFVGIGRWRTEKRGLYGRFKVTSMRWS